MTTHSLTDTHTSVDHHPSIDDLDRAIVTLAARVNAASHA